MSTQSNDAENARAYVRLLQNPYASLSIQDEPEESIPVETTLEQKRTYFRKLENPHAHSEVFGESTAIQESVEAKPTPLVSPKGANRQISKRDFQDGCRRILLQYTPPDEGPVLRQHYRDFISRNENRSPEQRFRFLNELGKYDISTSGNFKPQFNREQELLTARKLEQIERAVETANATK